MSVSPPSAPPEFAPGMAVVVNSAEPPIVAIASNSSTAAADDTARPEMESAAEDETSFWVEFWRTSPTWAISMLVHLLLVLGLTLYTTAEVMRPGNTLLTANLGEAPVEIENQIDEVIKLEQFETSLATLENHNPSESAIDTSDTAMAPLKTEHVTASDLPAITEFGDDAKDLFREIGDGMSDKPGAGNTATFFGVPAKGKKFCFVVDNSRSMKGAKFQNALYELGMAIDKLKPDQSFYIVFFSDQPYPLFYPQSAAAPILATPQNKQLLAKWLPTVELHLKTKGSEAMKIALDLNVDAIYLLGDGAFTDNTVKELMAREPTRTKIHTIGFNMKEGSRQAKDFEEIAKKFYGTYREVSEKPVK